MRIFYDTEFIEDGRTIDLISIGMVAENGDEYYAISSEFDRDVLLANPWLVANVLPSLPLARGSFHDGEHVLFDPDHPDFPSVKPRVQIADEVRQFVLGHPDPELWADYGAYDHVALAQLFGRMIDLPAGMPMWTNDLRQEMARLGLSDDELDVVLAGVAHNALDDARHLRDQYARVELAHYPVRYILGTDQAEDESNLVQHARRELALCAETDEPFKLSLLAAVQGFASYRGHSGGSAAIAQDMVGRLLRFENLAPLTDDPDEWTDRTEMSGQHWWQSTRNSAAMSHDGGKTYWLVDEKPVDGERVMHASVPRRPAPSEGAAA